MSIYGSGFFYGTKFYGTDVNSNPSGGIFGENAYQNVDGSVILYWRYDPCTAVLPLFTWTVQTDLAPTFDSVNLLTYSSVANPNFIAGGVNKGIVVPTYARQQGEEIPMYWRVQGHYGGNDTTFASSVFMIPEAIDDIVRQQMLDTIPDVIYKKDFAAGDFQMQSLVFNAAMVSGNVFNVILDGVALSPVSYSISSSATMTAIASAISARPEVGSAVVQAGGLEILVTSSDKDLSITFLDPMVTGGAVQPQISIVQKNTSSINRVYTALGQVMDAENVELGLTYLQLFTQSVRDSALNANFASIFAIPQPTTMQTIDYREIIRSIVREVGSTPSLGSIKRVLNAVYCEDPSFTLIRNTIDMYVDDPTSSPPVPPFYVDDPSSSPPVLPATVWDDHNLAFGVIITINNPLGLSIPASFVQQIVGMMAPAHAPIYIIGI